MYFANLSEVLPQAKGDTVRIIAVSSETRMRQLPDVPTVVEFGFPGFRTVTWNALMAAGGYNKGHHQSARRGRCGSRERIRVTEELLGYGVEPVGGDLEQFAKTISADILTWSEAIKLAGVKL